MNHMAPATSIQAKGKRVLVNAPIQGAAADYMKDDGEYQKHLNALTMLVGSTAAENDLQYRGAEFGTDTPTPGDYY